MTFRKTVRALALFTAVFGLLLFVTEVGEACEAWQHQPCTNDCIICHLPQQAVEPAHSAQPRIIFERIGLLPAAPEPAFVLSSCALQMLTRAPPSV